MTLASAVRAHDSARCEVAGLRGALKGVAAALLPPLLRMARAGVCALSKCGSVRRCDEGHAVRIGRRDVSASGSVDTVPTGLKAIVDGWVERYGRGRRGVHQALKGPLFALISCVSIGARGTDTRAILCGGGETAAASNGGRVALHAGAGRGHVGVCGERACGACRDQWLDECPRRAVNVPLAARVELLVHTRYQVGGPVRERVKEEGRSLLLE